MPKPTATRKNNRLVELAGCVLGCELAGGIGALFTTPNIPTWYASLAKPSFTPPAWVFGPVWTLLYAMMGAALWLVRQAPAKKGAKRMAYAAFAVQLALNVLWSLAFFGLKSPAYGVAVIVLLWLAIAATIVLFWRFDRKAALLLLPYLAWVSFASLLNYSIFALN